MKEEKKEEVGFKGEREVAGLEMWGGRMRRRRRRSEGDIL